MKTSSAIVVTLLVAAAAPCAMANLLVDPGFESNPLNSLGTVLSNFTVYQGVWGVEAATITGVDGGVTPAGGVKMLRMVDDGLVATQAVQMTDVSSYTGVINNGAGIVSLAALFNVDKNVPAAVGGVTIAFFSAGNFGSLIGGPITSNLNPLDANAGTWETASLTVPIPVGTKWIMSQVAYSNASLLGNPGYVDDADLRIVPTPSSLALLAIAGGVGLRRRR
jgi:hypothetical protein